MARLATCEGTTVVICTSLESSAHGGIDVGVDIGLESFVFIEIEVIDHFRLIVGSAT